LSDPAAEDKMRDLEAAQLLSKLKSENEMNCKYCGLGLGSYDVWEKSMILRSLGVGHDKDVACTV